MRSRRRADPLPHEFDTVLRGALSQAAESVEPGQDGLDKITAKIAAKQVAHRRISWRTAAAPGTGRPWWRVLFPPRGWLPAMVDAVAERFGRDLSRPGWFGWLRPLAAAITGLFVVSAASLAVAALPSVISPSGHTKVNASATPKTRHRTSRTNRPSYTGPSTGGQSSSQHGSTPGPNGGPSATPSCTSSPSSSPSTSPSVSPTGTPSSSATGTPTGTASPPPTAGQSTPPGSPTAGASPAPAVTPQATGKALLSPGAFATTHPDTASGATPADPPFPTSTPQPTTSPTTTPAPPYPAPSPTPPPIPC